MFLYIQIGILSLSFLFLSQNTVSSYVQALIIFMRSCVNIDIYIYI